jgi:hypothetical protein
MAMKLKDTMEPKDTKGEFIMRATVIMVVAALIGGNPVMAVASQRAATSAEEVKALQEMAAAIPLGSRVKVHTREGRRMTATLMSTTADAIVVQRDSRVPEPAVTIRFDELARLQRDERSGGISLAKGIGIGVTTAAAAILTVFAIAMSIDD